MRLPAGWAWRCPSCGASLAAADGPGAPEACQACGWSSTWVQGLVDLRPPDQAEALARIAATYADVRRAEGRDRWTLEDLAALPWPSAAMPEAWEWPIRAGSYDCLYDQVLATARLAARADARPRVLDLGAGLGWLGHRLAWLGWRALALDLCPDPGVALGAATLLQARLASARALETDLGSLDLALADYHRLPLADACAELVVFNASLHYARDPAAALREAWRCLVPGGCLAIMDSPFYVSDEAGAAMVAAQRQAFRSGLGVEAAAPEARGYLSLAGLRALDIAADLSWVAVPPRRGWRWRLRRRWRSYRLRRESADFPLVLAVKP